MDRRSVAAQDRDEPQQLDVLALDAFSSDSIPMHLLTRECVEIYWQHLKPDGILALHISNRYVSLHGVCQALANEFKKKMIIVDSNDDDEIAQSGSTWVLLTSNRQFIDNPARRDATYAYDDSPPEQPGVLKARADEVKADELARLLNKLGNVDERARSEITSAFDRLVNKLLHPPLESLRDEAEQGTPHGLLDALKRLFKLKD